MVPPKGSKEKGGKEQAPRRVTRHSGGSQPTSPQAAASASKQGTGSGGGSRKRKPEAEGGDAGPASQPGTQPASVRGADGRWEGSSAEETALKTLPCDCRCNARC